MNTRTFPAGTVAKCNRCSIANPLPKVCEGHISNTWKGTNTAGGLTFYTLYRLDTMCVLDCGHMDSHWVCTTQEKP